MRRLLTVLACVAGWWLAASGGIALGEGPRGIAFVQAPEQSSGFCIGDDPETTIACARAKCVAGGAEEADCLPDAWCFPMGWSADVFVQSEAHWHEYLCGWPSREALLAAVKVRCDRSIRADLLECEAVNFWDENGEELEAK